MLENFTDNMDYSTPEYTVTLALPNGYVLNDYKIESLLGQGSYGITYLALDMVEGKQVVIKENFPRDSSLRNQRTHTVRAASPDTQEAYDWALTRFLDEAKLLIDLSHPNIVPVLHCFQAMGTAYYVMPHIGGQELHLAAPPPFEITEKWLRPILECLLDALSYMHEQNLLHRDIKPNNILVHEDGTPVIIDFGTARALRNTHTHTKIGTPGFTPLEQYSTHGKRGPWTDFYALGATCYYLLTGELPPDVHERADEDSYVPLANRSELLQRFSRPMLHSIDVALRMNRRERWQNAPEWLAAMRGINLRPTETEQAPKDNRSAPQHPWNKTPLLVGGAIAAFGIIGALLLSSSPEEEPINPPQQAQEEEARRLAEQQAQEEEARRLAEQQAQEEEARRLAEQQAQEEEARRLAEQQAQEEEEARKQAEQRAQEEEARRQARREVERRHAEEQARRQAAEQARRQAEEEARRETEEEARRHSNPQTALHEAVINNNVALLQEAIQKGANVNYLNSGRTALYIAASSGYTECVAALLQVRGINLNYRCPGGKTALYQAAENGCAECVRLLVNTQGINVNVTDNNRQTPLYTAARYGRADCVRELLKAPYIEVNAPNFTGATPLCIAAYKGHVDCVAELLSSPNIDVTLRHGGNTALDYAIEEGHQTCANLIREYIRRRNSRRNTAGSTQR